MNNNQSLSAFLRRYRPVLLLAALTILLAGFNLTGRGAGVAGAAGDTGIRDFNFGFTQAPGGDPNNGPTGEKPQSKLWYNAGTWWGVMYNPAAGTGGEYHIYRFSSSNQTWSDTGVFIDSRRESHSDTLWDGSHLYVATAVQPGTGDTDLRALVYRFSYNASTNTYSLDSGFPVAVANQVMEAIVIDKDTTGMLWVTFTGANSTGGRNVYVAHSTTGDAAWAAPYIIPAQGTQNLTADDISSVVAFSGQIGVMWSNQTDSTMYWATHTDGAADNVWAQNPALQGPSYADDHINLKSLQADPAGRVFAAVKTSLQDIANQNPSQPQLLLLYLDQHGSWNRRTFSTVGDNQTRPIVLIDTDHRNLYMFATTNNGNAPSAIIYKATPIDNINFPSGQGTVFMQSSTDTNINNATSKKGSVNSQTGLLVLASDLSTGNYWHNSINLAATGTLPTATPSTSTPTPTPAATTNLALNRPAVASSLESSSYPASNAVDGNTSTRWSSQFSDPQWIYVDLGSSYNISSVTLMWETAYASAFQIQVSSDATNW
ncbi:MAG TPA: discoidin domain-containing protein, partial [Chloroflexota bacterium]